jgi:hypothetical protein
LVLITSCIYFSFGAYTREDCEKRKSGRNARPGQTQDREKRKTGTNARQEQTHDRETRSLGVYILKRQPLRQRVSAGSRDSTAAPYDRAGPRRWLLRRRGSQKARAMRRFFRPSQSALGVYSSAKSRGLGLRIMSSLKKRFGQQNRVRQKNN